SESLSAGVLIRVHHRTRAVAFGSGLRGVDQVAVRVVVDDDGLPINLVRSLRRDETDSGGEVRRGTRQVGVRNEVVVGVREDVPGALDRLLHADVGPRNSLVRRETDVPGRLQNLRGGPADRREDELAVDRDRSEEAAAVLVLADDLHSRDRLLAIEPDLDVERTAGGLDRLDAQEMKGAHLNAGPRNAVAIEHRLIQALHDRVGLAERPGFRGGDRKTREDDLSAERLGLEAEETGRDGLILEVDEGLAVARRLPEIHPALDRAIGGERGQGDEEQCGDASDETSAHFRPPLERYCGLRKRIVRTTQASRF